MNNHRPIRSFLNVGFGCVSLVIACWISDLAFISSIIVIALWIRRRFNLHLRSWSIDQWIVAGIVVLSCLGGYFFISYAKEKSAMRHTYTEVADFRVIVQTIRIFIDSIWDILRFKGKEVFTSVCAWLTVPIILWVIGRAKNSIQALKQNPVLSFLLLDCLFVLGAILISEWTQQNGVPRRYFVCTYITFSILLLILIEENLRKSETKRILEFCFLIPSFIGGLGSIYHLYAVWPGTLKPRVDSVREMSKLGEVGIIGNYWNAYINSVSDHHRVVAIPNALEQNRKESLITEVFKREKIYVIKDMWLTDFPDTLVVLNRKLIKNGDGFYCGDSNMCQYKLIGN